MTSDPPFTSIIPECFANGSAFCYSKNKETRTKSNEEHPMRGANEQARLSAIAGPPDTFPILFVHGAAWTRSLWMPQMQVLSDAFLLVTTLVSERRLTQMQATTLRSMFSERVVEPQLKAGFAWKVMPQVYRELARHHFSTLLQTYPGPVLLLNGEHDKLNRKREAVLLHAAQHGQLHIIKGANHLCNLEQPEAFTEQVRLFAQQLSM
jgi:pimeloyl-ACP methyl ester carboxylesterase